jgi:hypothetical protein
MTCFCSAPDCGNWLKTISQKQISFTVFFRSKIVWSYLPERIRENLFAQPKSKNRFALEWIAELELKMNQRSRSDAFCWNCANSSPLMSLRSFGEQHITAHTRKAKHLRQSKSFVTFGIFVSNKAFRSTFLALQVCAKRYWQYEPC